MNSQSRTRHQKKSLGESFDSAVKYVVVGLAAVAVATLVYIAMTPVQATGQQAGPIPTFNGVDPNRVEAAFLGDSYTHGTGSGSLSLRWTTLVAEESGWFELNRGLGGTGFLTTSSVSGCGRDYCPNYVERIAEVVADGPEIVVISGGQNDFGALDADPQAVFDAVTATYAGVREALPDAQIIAVGPSSPGVVNDIVRSLDGHVQATAASVGADYVSLIDPPVIDRATMMAPDGGHVNDLGHRAIADRVRSLVAQ